MTDQTTHGIALIQAGADVLLYSGSIEEVKREMTSLFMMNRANARTSILQGLHILLLTVEDQKKKGFWREIRREEDRIYYHAVIHYITTAISILEKCLDHPRHLIESYNTRLTNLSK